MSIPNVLDKYLKEFIGDEDSLGRYWKRLRKRERKLVGEREQARFIDIGGEGGPGAWSEFGGASVGKSEGRGHKGEGRVFAGGGEGIGVCRGRGGPVSWGDEFVCDADCFQRGEGRGLAGMVWNSLSTLCMNVLLTA
jgi:hypothetical protein